MKYLLRYLLFIGISFSILASSLCQSEVQYTFLKECKETINNDNAAFSELSCPKIGDYKVSITEQSPQYFNIVLSKGDRNISSNFTAVTNENPVNAGKAIEWHITNNQPQYMIFRLSWGSTENPFKMKEHLVVNLVTEKDICVLATVDVKKNKKSNQKARDLISGKFKNSKSCPKSTLKL